MVNWLTCEQFAALAGIPVRTARYAIAASVMGRTWKGSPLHVREISGRGGRSGLRYEIALNSLPDALQEAFKRASNTVAAPIAPQEPAPYVERVADHHGLSERRYAIIEPAVRWGLTPGQRAIAVKRIVHTSGEAETTLRRWIAAYDRHGLVGLGRKRPADAGKPRVAVSRRFDSAFVLAGGGVDQLPALSEKVDDILKGLWKGRAGDAGWADLGKLAEFLLFEHCGEHLGLKMTLEDCSIGRQRVERYKNRRVVNLRNNNAAAFHNSLPRIARDWTKHDPMATVIGDVKHLDVLVTRADGSSAYPKLIAFMDAGTGRVFPYLVLCPTRRSITQELVIEAFCAMANDPHWGFPDQLYLDNGSEFGGLDKIKGAMSLLNKSEGREIVHAKAYNAAAKPIEPLFARLDRYCFSSMPGYTGPDRMNKKTQNHGREPEPWKGNWESFVETVGGLIAYYHQRVMAGQWNASPNELFRSKVEGNWRPVLPRPLALEMAFCDHTTKKRTKQGIRIGGANYTHPQLSEIPVGECVEVMVPWRKGDAPLIVLPQSGPVILAQDMAYPAMASAGAEEAARRQQAYKKNVARIAAEGPIIDPVSVKLRMAALAEPIAIPGRSHFLDQGASVHQLAELAQAATGIAADDRSNAERMRRRAIERDVASWQRRQNNAS